MLSNKPNPPAVWKNWFSSLSSSQAVDGYTDRGLALIGTTTRGPCFFRPVTFFDTSPYVRFNRSNQLIRFRISRPTAYPVDRVGFHLSNFSHTLSCPSRMQRILVFDFPPRFREPPACVPPKKGSTTFWRRGAT